MPVLCQICLRQFDKQITNSHLKNHLITTAEYKNRYGDDALVDAEYRRQLSLNRQGANNSNFGKSWSQDKKAALSSKLKNKQPWNKGMKVSSSERMKQAIIQRELKYEKGELSREGRRLTDDQKKRISQGVKQYLTDNPLLASLRAKKAVATKIKNGYDFGANVRGKKHSEQVRKKIAEHRKATNLIRSQLALEARLKKIAESNLELKGTEGVYLSLKCLQCQHEFTLTKQCFTQSKFKNSWCQVCNPLEPQYRSRAEIELYEFVKSLAPDAVHSQRRLLGRQEIDIYIPSKKIAIEFNGLYWHSEKILTQLGKSKHSDYEKMLKTHEIGLRYIGIFEDEWLAKKEIVKSRLNYLLGNNKTKFFARKCKVKQITSLEASTFCTDNHIQGRGRSNVRYGLFHDQELMAVMTFSQSNISRKITSWEINRFCTKLNVNIVGGAGKLFSEFVRNFNPVEVVSYADSRWSQGNLYQTLGFDFIKQTVPNYWYVPSGVVKRMHRFSLRKTINDDPSMTEAELRQGQGYQRIWDCGSTKWLWKNDQHA